MYYFCVIGTGTAKCNMYLNIIIVVLFYLTPIHKGEDKAQFIIMKIIMICMVVTIVL